jgi:hypothetical protein
MTCYNLNIDRYIGIMYKVRSWSEFMMWNHIFILYEMLRGIYWETYILAFLGGSTIVMSIYRHYHYENRCNTIEHIVAKITEMYMLLYAIITFNMYTTFTILIMKLWMVLWWYMEIYNYERMHPWLHMWVAIDVHYWINCYIEHHTPLVLL